MMQFLKKNLRVIAFIGISCVSLQLPSITFASMANEVVEDSIVQDTVLSDEIGKTAVIYKYQDKVEGVFEYIRNGGAKHGSLVVTNVALPTSEFREFREYVYAQHFGTRPLIKSFYFKDSDLHWIVLEEFGLQEGLAEHDQAVMKLDQLAQETVIEGHDAIIQFYVDYMQKNYTYDRDVLSVYSMLEKKTGACYPLSVMFYQLMKREGIPCRVCIGYSSYGVSHAWNQVQMEDGTWRYLDLSATAFGFPGAFISDEDYKTYYRMEVDVE